MEKFFQYGARTNNSVYSADWFRKKKVMIMVPHQDDEIITTGLILDYLSGGSHDTILVFSTNGDGSSKTEGFLRIEEAIMAAEEMGIDSANVIFLGYGDQWKGSHIYNQSGLCTSISGRTETYGLEGHSEYIYKKEQIHHQYTRQMLLLDITNVILDTMPDIIFCTDCDDHSDHIALSLLFEEAMSDIMKHNEHYCPIVYKMFSYDSLWRGNPDFYSINLKSCLKPSSGDGLSNTEMIFDTYYAWDNRIRFPISRRYLHYSSWFNAYRSLARCYESQLVKYRFARLLNGDQIFWERRTDNLIYHSRIEASSGDVSCLYSMKMFDCDDVNKTGSIIQDSRFYWSPSANDQERTITFYFKNEVEVAHLYLYRKMNKKEEIIQYMVTFSNGDIIESGLMSAGKATPVQMGKTERCSWFSLKILAWHGESPGICKVEAFSKKEDELILIKTMIDDDFIYTYHVRKNLDTVYPRIYVYENHHVHVDPFSDDQYMVDIVSGDRSDVVISEGAIRFSKTFRYARIRVSSKKEKNVYDEIEFVRYALFFLFLKRIYGFLEHITDKVVYKVIREMRKKRSTKESRN